jgi:hypothetical protein
MIQFVGSKVDQIDFMGFKSVSSNLERDSGGILRTPTKKSKTFRCRGVEPRFPEDPSKGGNRPGGSPPPWLFPAMFGQFGASRLLSAAF